MAELLDHDRDFRIAGDIALFGQRKKATGRFGVVV
jgi:hypothetical protein